MFLIFLYNHTLLNELVFEACEKAIKTEHFKHTHLQGKINTTNLVNYRASLSSTCTEADWTS